MGSVCRLISRRLTPELQVKLAWFQLVVCVVGWPVSLIFIDEPKVILSLSWWAILETALGHLSAAQANEKVNGQGSGKENT